MICVCKLQTSIDCTFWDVSSFEVTFGAQDGHDWETLDVIVQNLIVCGMDPIPILYQIASLKVALLSPKSRSRAEHPENFDKIALPRSILKISKINCAPARNILEISKEIAILCEASSKF